MENLSLHGARGFVAYCLNNNMQVTVNRRSAYQLLTAALDERGPLSFPIEKFEKLMSFLMLSDQQTHTVEFGGPVAVYAFVRLLGDLRRTVRALEEGSNRTASESHETA